MKKEFALLDVCYPDYFSGYNRPVIAVPVFNNMLISELAQGIEQELNSSYEYLTNEDNGFTKTEILIIDEFVRDLLSKGDDVFLGQEFDYSDDDDDMAFAYLSIIKPVYSNGIKFLN